MIYWVGLGANLGDRLATLRRAALALEQLGEPRARSRIFSSAPVGGPPQPPFLNAAVSLDSPLAPTDFLHALWRIEAEEGRDRAREARWGPRLLDLDLLLAGEAGERTIVTPELVVPHPRLHERAFALAPLVDLDGELVHPIARRKVAALFDDAVARGQAVSPTGDAL
ncbi:MAG TPA: 2-amino-4-hydroxy-6-hydroxymethyldihydropteridine diphosphokinase [Polyangia bacterium]